MCMLKKLVRGTSRERFKGNLDERLSFVVCIVGPTASEKSAFAEEVAKNLHSSVVSVDAMQVYKGMDIERQKFLSMSEQCLF